MEYEVEGARRRGRPKRTWKEVVQEDCQACKLNKEDAMDRCKWRKVMKEVRWPGWVWAGECFFWYRPTRVVPDKRPLNGCCCHMHCFSLFLPSITLLAGNGFGFHRMFSDWWLDDCLDEYAVWWSFCFFALAGRCAESTWEKFLPEYYAKQPSPSLSPCRFCSGGITNVC